MLPKTVIYDPGLSRKLPPGLSFVSGLIVIAHAAEGLHAHDGNPIMSPIAEDGIRALATGLRGIKNEPQSLVARSGCLYGARLCGCVLGTWGWSCITSFVMLLAEASTCRMRKRTRSYYLTGIQQRGAASGHVTNLPRARWRERCAWCLRPWTWVRRSISLARNWHVGICPP